MKNELKDKLVESVNEDVPGAIARSVSYVFSDENCKLKVKSTGGKYFMFNSKEEFYSIVSRLDFEECATADHINDEDDELYY